MRDATVAVLKLALAVVAIALPDCINPSLIAGELFVATGSHPRRRTAVFTLAAWTVTFVFGLALALGLGDLILSLVPTPTATTKYALVTAAGLALMLGSTIVWIRREALASEPKDRRNAAPGSAAVVGAAVAGVELLTAFPYFAAIAMIVGSGVSNAEKVSLIILYCVVYTLPLIVIAAVFAVMGERADQLLRPAGDWLLAHWPVIAGPLTGLFGIGILVFGIVQLISI